MAIKAPKPTAAQRKIIRKHYVAPFTFKQRDAMEALGLGYDYHAFNALFYRCMMAQS